MTEKVGMTGQGLGMANMGLRIANKELGTVGLPLPLDQTLYRNGDFWSGQMSSSESGYASFL